MLLSIFIVQFALSFRPDALAWDGVFYYAYTRSTVCDGDLRLRNDLVLSYDVTPARDFVAEHFEERLTPTGRVANPFAIGTSLLWLPWFALIYSLARLVGSIGLGPGTLTCYEWPFVWGMAAVTCVYGWVTVLTGFQLIRKFVGDRAALVASATVMFTTPLCYYQFREPFYAHAASAMTTALFIAAWWRWASCHRTPCWASCHGTLHCMGGSCLSVLLGALGGLAALVRSQNVTYLILPATTVLSTSWAGLRRRDWRTVRQALCHILSVGLGALSVLALQVIVWYIFYGQPVTVPQGTTFVDWSAPWVGHVLLSAFHGLLPWMPLAVPAVIGLILLARRTPKLGIPLLIAFLMQIYVNSCVRDWFGGGGYGPRRFSNASIILLAGYAFLLDWRKERWYRLLTATLSGLLTLHQWLILRYGFAEQIGGYVVSMAPSYEWHADGIARFGRQLIAYIPMAIRKPIQTLIFPASPLGTARRSLTLFARQILLLLGVLTVLCLLQTSWSRLARACGRSPAARWFLLTCVVALVVLASWWLLKRA